MSKEVVDDKFNSAFEYYFDLEMKKPGKSQVIEIYLHENDLRNIINN